MLQINKFYKQEGKGYGRKLAFVAFGNFEEAAASFLGEVVLGVLEMGKRMEIAEPYN